MHGSFFGDLENEAKEQPHIQQQPLDTDGSDNDDDDDDDDEDDTLSNFDVHHDNSVSGSSQQNSIRYGCSSRGGVCGVRVVCARVV